MPTLKAEVFAVGKWNGIDITQATLVELANNFARLKEVVDVPLKFGHNDEQPLTDGQPALGWIETVWVEGTKLFAKFVDMPDIVFNAIENKRFKNVSIEALFNVEHKGVEYGTVLTAVAILGVDMPAVNTLSDLQTYMTANNLSFSKFATFSKKPTVGVSTMTDDEKAQMDALRAQVEAQKIVINENAVSSAKFSSETAKDKELIKSLESEKTASSFAAEKLSIVNDLEQLVKDAKITPATRDKLLGEFSVDTKDHVTFSIKMLKDLPANSPGTNFTAKEDGGQNGNDNSMPADVRVSNSVNTLMTANSNLSYGDALQSVFTSDPKLAEEYKNQNNQG